VLPLKRNLFIFLKLNCFLVVQSKMSHNCKLILFLSVYLIYIFKHNINNT